MNSLEFLIHRCFGVFLLTFISASYAQQQFDVTLPGFGAKEISLEQDGAAHFNGFKCKVAQTMVFRQQKHGGVAIECHDNTMDAMDTVFWSYR